MGKKGKIGRYLDPDKAVPLVHSYYKGAARKDGTNFPYSGGQFEFLCGGGNRGETANRITADDIVAVSLLGVDVPAFASLQILGPDSRRISGLLEQLPRLQKLGETEIDALLDPSHPAMRLWVLLRSIPGMGSTKVSKLMARKRPHLIPVYDSIIGSALGGIDGHWERVHEAVTKNVEVLSAIRSAAGLTTRVPLIRVIDVAVWMQERGASQLPKGGRLVDPRTT